MSQPNFEGYELREDGILMYRCRVYVPNDQDLKKLIFLEIHEVPYARHPSYQKTIVTVKNQYFWPGMKKEVVDFIAKCLDFRRPRLSTNIQCVCFILFPFLNGSGKL
jgi:hypothetical protein